MTPTSDTTAASPRRDRGFTLIEIVTVVVILGILSVVVTFSVRGSAEQAQASVCGADARTLAAAVESWFANEADDALPAMGTSPNRYELALIDAGYLEQVSTVNDLESDGTVIETATGQPCP